MPTFDESWSGKVRIIGDLERPDHIHLRSEDRCFFFGEYTARAGFGYSSTNQLILNLKKNPELAGTPQYVWKGRAIQTIGAAIRANLDLARLGELAIIPIPPSKPSGAPGYDDRMARVARAIGADVDVREALVTKTERDPMHVKQGVRDPIALRASLATVTNLLSDPRPQVILVDDVLTTGCSFVVCKAMIQEAWPDARILGLFVARRAIDRTADFDGVTEVDF
jgi:hypothetical protein